MSERRVVVTGIGMITPIGLNVIESWDNLLSGKCGIFSIHNLDTSNLPVKIAGLIGNSLTSDFDPENFLDAKSLGRMDTFMQYGIIASIEAIKDSGLDTEDEEIKNNTGTVIGSGIGGLKAIEQTAVDYYVNQKKISPFFIPSCLSNLISGNLSIRYGFRGPNHSVVTACATGTNAIGDAARMIKYGDANVMVAGGAESAVTPLGIMGFASAKALTTKYNDNPQLSCRPWDEDRSGFVMSEGAGIVVLEELEHAKRRKAKIYAEVVGYGLSSDAYHITSPHPEGAGSRSAIIKALNDGKISPQEIDYINAHATSTIAGDLSELKTIQDIFLNTNPKLSVSSTKGSTGHMLGAAGSVETIFSILALYNQTVPPTLNLDNPIPDTKINLVPNYAQQQKLKYVLNNSFGFGGTNTCIALKRWS